MHQFSADWNRRTERPQILNLLFPTSLYMVAIDIEKRFSVVSVRSVVNRVNSSFPIGQPRIANVERH